jgi:hypothetical protein
MSGLQHQTIPGDVMSPVVLITAGKTIRYSRDNGVTMLEYEDKELYEVPDYVARGMYKRGWAKPAKLGGNGEQHPHDPGKEQPAPPPVQEPEQQPKPEPDGDDNGDNGDHHQGDQTAALRTKSKRSRS